MLWQPELLANSPLCVKWLKETQYLSRALRDVFDQWHIKVLYQHKHDLTYSQQERLSGLSGLSWQRAIVHMHHNKPLIIGRVVVPEKTYSLYHSQLENLQHRSIGDLLLFNDSNIKRSDFLFSQLYSNDLELNELPSWLFSDEHMKLYARSSIFYLKGKDPLMIEEYFLSTFFQEIEQTDKAKALWSA